MSQQDFLEFLLAARDSPAMLARYNQRNLGQLPFHAKHEGFDFTAEEMAEVRGRLEANVILVKDQDQYDGSSRLWRQMWGRYHLEYLVDHVVRRHTDEELWSLIETRAPEVG
ncbi:MAG: hypothetical protein ACRD0K_08560 [Egibacteraceae bacterium]